MKPTDLALAFYVTDHQSFGVVSPPADIDKLLTAHAERGGTILALPLSDDFRTASKVALTAEQSITSRPRGAQKHVTVSADVPPPSIVPDDATKFNLWETGTPTAFATAMKVGKGTLVTLSDGLPATNRFIDRADNAEVLLSIIQPLVPRGGRIVFTEATFGGGREPSLLATIGPWAQAGWMQLLFLFVVIVLTLGFRFGLADERRVTERGQRELLEAVADTYQRGRMTRVAFSSCL